MLRSLGRERKFHYFILGIAGIWISRFNSWSSASLLTKDEAFLMLALFPSCLSLFYRQSTPVIQQIWLVTSTIFGVMSTFSFLFSLFLLSFSFFTVFIFHDVDIPKEIFFASLSTSSDTLSLLSSSKDLTITTTDSLATIPSNMDAMRYFIANVSHDLKSVSKFNI
jgi:hypothetical protein